MARYSDSIRGHVHGDAPRETCAETVGRALKLVVERAWPHRIVGVHIFGPDACELIHYGTTLVQALHTTYSRAIARSTRTTSATPAGA